MDLLRLQSSSYSLCHPKKLCDSHFHCLHFREESAQHYVERKVQINMILWVGMYRRMPLSFSPQSLQTMYVVATNPVPLPAAA